MAIFGHLALKLRSIKFSAFKPKPAIDEALGVLDAFAAGMDDHEQRLAAIEKYLDPIRRKPPDEERIDLK